MNKCLAMSASQRRAVNWWRLVLLDIRGPSRRAEAQWKQRSDQRVRGRVTRVYSFGLMETRAWSAAGKSLERAVFETRPISPLDRHYLCFPVRDRPTTQFHSIFLCMADVILSVKMRFAFWFQVKTRWNIGYIGFANFIMGDKTNFTRPDARHRAQLVGKKKWIIRLWGTKHLQDFDLFMIHSMKALNSG